MYYMHFQNIFISQYQSYSSNWYMIGEVFTSTTAWGTQKIDFHKKIKHLTYLSVSAVMFCIFLA